MADEVSPIDLTAGIAPQQTASPFSDSGFNTHFSPQTVQLAHILHTASEQLPQGYSVKVTSVDRPGAQVAGGGGISQHALGDAIDIQIVGPNGAIPNSGPDSTGLYRKLAVAASQAQQQLYPQLNGKLAWGGNFETGRGSGVADLMHFDLGGDRGRFGTLAALTGGASPAVAQQQGSSAQVASAAPAATAAPTTAQPSGLTPELRAALTAAAPQQVADAAQPPQPQQQPAQIPAPKLNSPPPGQPATAYRDAVAAIRAHRSANPFASA